MTAQIVTRETDIRIATKIEDKLIGTSIGVTTTDEMARETTSTMMS